MLGVVVGSAPARTPAFLVVAVAGERAASDLVGAGVILGLLALVAATGYLYRDRLPVVGTGTAEHHSRLPKRNR